MDNYSRKLLREREEQQRWRDSLQPGDAVFVSWVGLRDRRYTPSKVAKLTKRWIVLENHDRYWRHNGKLVADTYGKDIVKPSREITEQLSRERHVSFLEGIRWESLPLTALEEIATLARKARDEQEDDGSE